MYFYLTAFPITECSNANRWDFLLSIKFVFVRLDRLYPAVRLDADVNACIRGASFDERRVIMFDAPVAAAVVSEETAEPIYVP